MKRPTYLFVLPWSLVHVGGVNSVVIQLAHEFQRAGRYEPMVLITDWNAVDPVWEEVHGIQCVRWRVRPFDQPMRLKERIAYLFWEARFRKNFAKFCMQHRVEVINLHYPGPNAFTFDRLVTHSNDSPSLILSFHGTDVSTIQSLMEAGKRRWRGLLTSGLGVVVCSVDLRGRLIEACGDLVVPTVIHNGIDAKAFSELGLTASLSDRRVILSVGKYIRLKGQDVLIDAFGGFASDYPDVDLWFVGADGDELPALRGHHVCKRYPDRVHFIVDLPHQQIASMFGRASIFVLPSHREAFGIVLLEAGVFGLPVVASDVGGIPELIVNHETGLLVEPGSPRALEKAIRSLLVDSVAGLAMGARLKGKVATHFTWSRAVALYSNMIAGTRNNMPKRGAKGWRHPD